MQDSIATITASGETRDGFGTRFWCEYEVGGLPYSLDFYVEHRNQQIQAAGQSAIVKFLECCGVSDADTTDTFVGLEFSLNEAIEIDRNSRIKPATTTRVADLESRIRSAGYVYVLSCVGSPYSICKIGRAESPKARVAHIATASPFALKLDYSVKVHDAGALERSAHFRFHDNRMNGEWFAMQSQEAIDFLSLQAEKCNHRYTGLH